MLNKAILKVKNKVFPELNNANEATHEPHVQLYNLLEIFDIPDADISNRVKFIYDYLMENGGNPKDQVISIHTLVGSNPHIPLVDKVWKYCKLKSEAKKAVQRYENILRDINAISSGR